eukprot:CAMPEP_0198138926 /NCGR_PEP_ID=MMETSP1443-20131203/2296_1 /TAXON_ID=186043 /ORGANISM="Entomoneis sp., Strain CCMP2396" /LENGTH=121 /DNA_ID=CAMNT_0043800883 /DNA_START=153 /DNA_END=516 /DNA_ORIENTATION=+
MSSFPQTWWWSSCSALVDDKLGILATVDQFPRAYRQTSTTAPSKHALFPPQDIPVVNLPLSSNNNKTQKNINNSNESENDDDGGDDDNNKEAGVVGTAQIIAEAWGDTKGPAHTFSPVQFW